MPGAGKTTAVLEKCSKLGLYKILYVCYNKSLAVEGQKAMKHLKHVTVSTYHSLAYKSIGYLYKDKRIESYTPYHIIQDLELGNGAEDYHYAYNFLTYWNKFLLSGEYTAKDFIDKNHLDFGDRDRVLNDMKRLFDKMLDVNDETKITDDFYAFLYHLKGDLLSEYDILIAEEAQDFSRLMAIMAKNFKGRLIVIGDTHQNIYSWRNTVNLFKEIKGVNIDFTYSFRVSQPIADICNKMFKDILDVNLDMKGMNSKNIIVKYLPENIKHVYMSRNRMALFDRAFDEVDKHRKVSFEGGIKSYGFDILVDAWFFLLGKTPKNPFLRNFSDWKEFVKYVEDSGDEESGLIVNMIKIKGGKIVDMYNAIKENTVTKGSNEWDTLFTTVHRSKGATYKIPLIVNDDVLNLVIVKTSLSAVFDNEYMKKLYLDKIVEQLNLLYVAITRGADLIVLPSHLVSWYNCEDDFIL